MRDKAYEAEMEAKRLFWNARWGANTLYPPCPRCEYDDCRRIYTPNQDFWCPVCRANFSLKSYTIMHHSKLNYRKWEYMMKWISADPGEVIRTNLVIDAAAFLKGINRIYRAWVDYYMIEELEDPTPMPYPPLIPAIREHVVTAMVKLYDEDMAEFPY